MGFLLQYVFLGWHKDKFAACSCYALVLSDMNKHNSKLCFHINVTLLKDRIWNLSCSRLGATLLGFVFRFSVGSDSFFFLILWSKAAISCHTLPKKNAFELAKNQLFTQIFLFFFCVSLSAMYFCSLTWHNLFPYFCNSLRKSDLPPTSFPLPTSPACCWNLKSSSIKRGEALFSQLN